MILCPPADRGEFRFTKIISGIFSAYTRAAVNASEKTDKRPAAVLLRYFPNSKLIFLLKFSLENSSHLESAILSLCHFT